MKFPDATIMVLDDDPNVGATLEMVLEGIAPVHAFTDAEEALEFMKGVKVSVAMVDQIMPGMQGTEVLAWMKEHIPETYRVLISGYSDRDVTNQAYSDGVCQYYFAKPWDTVEVRAIVSMAIRSWQNAQRLATEYRP